jgi:hypothetical protein
MKIINKYGLLGMLLLLVGCIEEPTVWPNTNRGNFEALWQLIDTRYCFLDYKSINWDSVKIAYQERVDTASNQYALFDVLSKMLAELKDGHVNIYSSFDKSRYWDWFLDYPLNFDPFLIRNHRYLSTDYKISGGMLYRKIANDKIGYVYLESFSSGFSSVNINQIFLHFADCQGLIIDVRSNGGGALTQAETLASYFFDKKTLTGYMAHKNGDGHSAFSTLKPIYTHRNPSIHWDKPVVVLTNRMSYSATNIFACRMHYAPHATLLGDKSGGGGGLPMSSELPIGWSVRFSACPIYDAEKNHVEWGITPDIMEDLDSTFLQLGYDSYIEHAIRIIQSTL